MPPIIYSSERMFDPKRKEVVAQQPSNSDVQVIYANLKLGPGRVVERVWADSWLTFRFVDPMLITCPSCGKNGTTRVDYRTGTKTHTCAFLLCAAGLDSCACLPYCMDSMKDALHYCPHCRSYLGKFCPQWRISFIESAGSTERFL